MKKHLYALLMGTVLNFSAVDMRAQDSFENPSFADADSAKIAYWVIGEGDPLLLVHGFLGRANNWSSYVEGLSKNRQLILVDLRDHGYSTNEKATYSNRDAAADLVAVLDAEGIDSADGVGFSAGAMAILNMAIHYPDRLKSGVAICGSIQNSDKTIELFKSFHPDSVSAPLLNSIASNHERGEFQALKLLRYLQDFSEYKGMHFSKGDLASIKVPVLIISGDRDLAIPFEQSVELYTSIPDSYLMVFPNTGHSISPADMEGKEYLIATLLGFFSKSWNCPAFCDK